MVPPAYIWEKLAPENHEIKVEIGAGAGLFSKAFQQISGKGKTYALDVSETMIDWMTENLVPENPDIIPMLTDGKVMPLDDETADIVFMITVHHELDDKISMLRECLRILKPGGKIFMADWNHDDLSFGPPVEIRSTAEEVVSQAETAGFKGARAWDGIANLFLVTAEKQPG